MYDLRRSAQKLADAKQSPEARNILKALSQDIEDLNVAARRKEVCQCSRGPCGCLTPWSRVDLWGLVGGCPPADSQA